MQNKMMETLGAKIRENFGKSNSPRGRGMGGNRALHLGRGEISTCPGIVPSRITQEEGGTFFASFQDLNIVQRTDGTLMMKFLYWRNLCIVILCHSIHIYIHMYK